MSEAIDPGTLPKAGLTGLDGYPHQWAGAFPTTSLELDVTSSAEHRGAGFAAALAELALTVKREGAKDDRRALHVITEAAAAIIPGTRDAAVVVADGPDRLSARAAHGDLPPRLLALQNETGQGPCLDAVQQTSPVLMAEVDQETRWPRFSGRAAALGVGSMLCTPLVVQGQVFGSLSLISTLAGAFGPESETLAAVFAAHAALALLGVRDVRNLAAMADSRDVIGQAKGILMERHKITSDTAFTLLTRASQRGNVKLRDICEQLALTGGTPDIPSG